MLSDISAVKEVIAQPATDALDGDVSVNLVSADVLLNVEGLIEAKFRAVDANDNSSNVIKQIFIADNDKLEYYLVGNTTIELEASMNRVYDDPSGSDYWFSNVSGGQLRFKDLTDISLVVVKDTSFNPNNVNTVGVFKYGYRIFDPNHEDDVSFLAQRTITVRDTLAPVITLTNSAKLVLNFSDVSNLKISDLPQVKQFTALDKANGDVSGDVLIEVDGSNILVYDPSLNELDLTFTLTYSFPDPSENFGPLADTRTRIIKVGDLSGPVVDLTERTIAPQLKPYNDLSLSDYFNWTSIFDTAHPDISFNQDTSYVITISGDNTRVFNVGGVLTVTISGEDAVECDVPDTSYVITYFVKDPANNETSGNRVITILPDTLGPSISLNYLPAGKTNPFVNGDVIKEYFDLHAFNYVESGGVALDIVDFSATAVNRKECPLTVTYQELSGGSYVDISLISMWKDASQVLGRVGTYKVLYHSVDVSDNSTNVVRKMFILSDSESPSIDLCFNHINVEAGEFDSSSTFFTSRYYTHNAGFINVTDTNYDSLDLSINSSLELDASFMANYWFTTLGSQGKYPITESSGTVFYDISEVITVTDKDLNTATINRTIRFVDTKGPSIVIPAAVNTPIELLWDTISGEPNLSTALNIDISDQACGPLSFGHITVEYTNDVSFATLGNSLPYGTIFTVKATDDYDNSSNVSVQVYIVPNDD